ncbi:MAG: hypothetical protein CL481_02650 [Acidobacteria bacterium]|nr:hypothetical protein [Acidobacteriota bacterium]
MYNLFDIVLRNFVRIAEAIVLNYPGDFHVRQALAYGFLFVAVFLFVPGMAMAQTDATVTGQITVEDDGSPLPGAMINILAQTTGYERQAVSSANGRYRIPGLTPGLYTITVQLQGFSTIVQTDLRLTISSEAVLDWNMSLADVEETITVTADTPLIETTSATVKYNLSSEEIENLPVKTRRWIDLATLAPGTSKDNIRGFYYNNVNLGAGTQWYANGFEVDGVNNTWAEMGEPRQNFPADSIAEFSVQTQNFKAEHGLATGGVLKTITKSGTNAFSGQAYWYFRNETLTATKYFDTEVPEYARHQFGGNFGGPIITNETHFFGSVERTDETDYFTVNTGGVHPTEEGTFTRDNFRNMYIIKFDQQWDSGNHTFFRYAREREYRPELNTGGTTAASAGFGFAVPRDSFVLGHNLILSDISFLEFRFQRAGSKYIVSPNDSGVGGEHQYDAGEFTAERNADCIPETRRPSLRYGGCNSQMGPEKRWQVKPDFSYYISDMRGSHDVKTGIDFNHIPFSADSCCDYPHEYRFRFDTDEPYDINNSDTHPYNFYAREATFDDMPVQHYSFYLQDDWRPTESLTLNLGLRWDAQPGVFNEGIEALLAERGNPYDIPWHNGDVPGYGSASERGDWNNFGPRFGFAFDPGGEGKSVFRGGYGLYYQNIQTLRQFSERRAGVAGRSISINNPNYEDPLQGKNFLEYLSTNPPNISLIDNNFENPMAQQFSLGYSHMLADLWSIGGDLTYVKSDNSRTTRDVNFYIDPFNRSLGRPYPHLARVVMSRTINPTRYKAMMLKLERRFSDGVQFSANYTLSHDVDSTSSDRNYTEAALEIGDSTADRRHRVNLSGMYMLPGQIQISGIIQWASTRPINVHSGRDLNGDGIGNDYPSGLSRNMGCRGLSLSEINSYRAELGVGNISDAACPVFSSVDLRLSKYFNIGGSQLQLFAQMFNVLNVENFSPPTGNLRSSNFGKVLQAGEARQVEVAVKVSF